VIIVAERLAVIVAESRALVLADPDARIE